MATLEELQAKLKKTLLPNVSAFDTTDATDYLNEGVDRIAAGIAMSKDVLSPPLPELFRIDSVNTVILTASTIAFVDGGASADTITDSDGAFVTSGFAAGMTIIVSGAGEDDNNATFHNITTVAAGTITLATSAELTAEAAGEEVTIKAACVALPSDYNRGLTFVSSVSQNSRIHLYSSFHKLLRRHPLLDETGDVNIVAVKGDYLYYQPIPSTAEALTLHYYRDPTAMSASSSEPDGIPSHLQERLLVNYAAKEITALVEEAVKGKTLRAEKFNEMFMLAMADLMAFIGPEDIEPIYLDNEQDLDDSYNVY